jgi:hypothetical protein
MNIYFCLYDVKLLLRHIPTGVHTLKCTYISIQVYIYLFSYFLN